MNDLHVYQIADGETDYFLVATSFLDALQLLCDGTAPPDEDYVSDLTIWRWKDDQPLTVGHEDDEDIPEQFRGRADDGAVTATCTEWVSACGRCLLSQEI